MKKEKAFSKGGVYGFMLVSNIMLHKQVAVAGSRHLSNWLKSKPVEKPIKVLDLACGGAPVTICSMMADFPIYTFYYTGVDINPDQVENAKTKFQYPGNVSSIAVFEGNAWDFSNLNLDTKYDVIFTGLNIHHGTPEEIYCLLRQSRMKLLPGGIFMNHDFYRPANLSYLRRPQVNPNDPTESFAMISNDVINMFHPPSFYFKEVNLQLEPDWRLKFFRLYEQALRERGLDEAGIQEMILHLMSRDFPVSITEMQQIANCAGLELNQLDLDVINEPLWEHFALVVAKPK